MNDQEGNDFAAYSRFAKLAKEKQDAKSAEARQSWLQAVEGDALPSTAAIPAAEVPNRAGIFPPSVTFTDRAIEREKKRENAPKLEKPTEIHELTKQTFMMVRLTRALLLYLQALAGAGVQGRCVSY
ncbi:hypothetical protein CYMTET_16869 [Cymbomonas tetramitiformis]|uniref:Uncharacterized protein n=1 Tax=Cymbomonas tetramitiformis TaxID=36881 RepID=A0AAE0GBB8_9CHLO|nr:hypothetical protein CYMTET_16869 [Cymbomonas tetramitiformis]